MDKDLMRRLMAPLTLLNRMLPKKQDRVVFYSNMGFRDNVKAVYDAFIARPESKNYEIVCALNDYELWDNRPHPANVRFTDCKGGLVPFLTSRTFFYSFGKYPVKPSKNQMVVNVWHGSPLKKIGRYEKIEDQDFFTYVLAASDFFVPIMAKAFGCPESKVKVCGHPRNDAMFTPGDPLGRPGHRCPCRDRPPGPRTEGRPGGGKRPAGAGERPPARQNPPGPGPLPPRPLGRLPGQNPDKRRYAKGGL